MRSIARVGVAVGLVAALGLQTGCMIRRERLTESTGAAVSKSEEVALGTASTGQVEIMLGAGQLRIGAGADAENLVEGDFDYRPASLGPVLERETSGASQRVVIRQGRQDDWRRISTGLFQGNALSEWDVRLSETVPIELVLSLGAGDGDVDLRGVNLETLSMDFGAGDVTVDLSGERDDDVSGTIQAGAGSIDLRFPRDVGVRVMGAQDGVGTWDAPGFQQEGNYYVNDAYDTSDVKIELNVQRGVGDVSLELVD